MGVAAEAWIRLGVRAAAALAGLALAGAPAGAEIVRLDAVGVAPVGGQGEAAGGLRQAAFERAVRDAVHQVASQQLSGRALPGDFQPAPSGRRETARERRERLLDEALGDDPLDYTTRFRILEDRGERPAVLSREAGVDREYVVVVEVHVDAERVRETLASRGLLAREAPSGDPGGNHVLLVVEAGSYRELRRLRELLEDELGAVSVVPVEMQRGRVVLAVRGAGGPGALQRALERARPPDLEIEPLGRSAQGLTLRLRLLRPTAAAPGRRAD